MLPYNFWNPPSFYGLIKEVIENGKTYTVYITCIEEMWYLKGVINKLHRENGPAYINSRYNIERYHLFGDEVSKEDFPKKLKLSAFW